MRLHVRGSHIRNAFSVDPLTIIEPDGFIARLYIESLEPAKFDAAKFKRDRQNAYSMVKVMKQRNFK